MYLCLLAMWSTKHGCLTFFITTDEQLQNTEAAVFQRRLCFLRAFYFVINLTPKKSNTLCGYIGMRTFLRQFYPNLCIRFDHLCAYDYFDNYIQVYLFYNRSKRGIEERSWSPGVCLQKQFPTNVSKQRWF